MVCAERTEMPMPKKAKKELKKKSKQEGNLLSANTEVAPVLAKPKRETTESSDTDIECKNDTQAVTELRKSKKKKRKRELIESSDCPVRTGIEALKTETVPNTEDCMNTNGTVDITEPCKSKKKKRKLQLSQSSNCINDSQIATPKSEVTSSGKDKNGKEELTKSRKSKKNKGNPIESSDCLNNSKIDDSNTQTKFSEAAEDKIEIGSEKTKESRKKKKKRKLMDQSDCPDNSETRAITCNEIEPLSKEHASIEKPSELPVSCDIDQTEVCTDDNTKHKKSKKRKKKECLDNVTTDVTVLSEGTIKPKKSKKRKKTDLNETTVDDETQELTDCSNVVPAKKRKKLTNEDDIDQNKESTCSDENPPKVKKSKKKVQKSMETSTGLPNNPDKQVLATIPKNDAEPASNAHDDVEVANTESNNDISNNEVIKKKKSKKDKKDCSKQLSSDTPESNSGETKKVKRKKKSKDSDTFEKHVSETVQECLVTTENNGSEQEHNVTSKPKKQKKKTAEETKTVDAAADASQTADDDLGQWKTAELSSSAHEKFARLLGARKKRYRAVVTPLTNLKPGESVLGKLTGVWKPPPERTLFGSLLNREKTFAKMAMDQKQTAKLNQSLETQYNKTLEFNLQKRKEGNTAKGLGFQEDPAKGKKLYIDVNKVKSVALD